MKLVYLVMLLLGAVSALPSRYLAPMNEMSEKSIPDEYIVVFKNEASDEHVRKHMKLVDLFMTYEPDDKKSEVQFVYDMGPTFRGYAARMSEQMIYAVRKMQEVEYVERNMVLDLADKYEADAAPPWMKNCRNQATDWALSRISHLNPQSGPNYNYRYNYFEEGIGVDVFVMDTGIDIHHPYFEGRAKWGTNVTPGGPLDDTDGHGTMVAGCAMAKTYGAARKGNAVAVKIDVNGKFTVGRAIAGLEWVQKNHRKNNAVANASYGGKTTALADATNALIDAGVPVVAAAGNYNEDACEYQPASVPRAITVAASDRNDNFASFSNWGNCVDLIAPGVDVETTGLHNQLVRTHGTSFSSPYTAGVLAAIMEFTPTSTAQTYLMQRTINDKIKGNLRGTPNKLLGNIC